MNLTQTTALKWTFYALAAAAQRLGSTSLGTSLSNADTIFLN